MTPPRPVLNGRPGHPRVPSLLEPLEARQLMSTVQVFAAGNAGGEQIQLVIRGGVVGTYTLTGANADAGLYETFVHETAGTLIADDVRVSFINDFYDPANDVDLNARIDAIAIDGVRFESEASETFSTGTWSAADRDILPGHGRGDTLHANGYFQYDGPDAPPPPPLPLPVETSTLRIFAAGELGDEQIQLSVGGAVARTWDGLGTGADAGQFVTLTYEAPVLLTPADIRLSFINDRFDEALGIDSNLRVDAIEIDGVRHETEADTVYSNATFRNVDEFTPGYGRGDTLHTNGYFQYDGASGRLQFVDQSYVVNEDDGTVAVQVERVGGLTGVVSVGFVTVDGSAQAGSDFTAQSAPVTFADGQGFANAVVGLINDGVSEGDESFSVSLNGVAGGATLGLPRTRLIEVRDDDTGPAGNGLLGEYFARRNFTEPLLRRTDAVIDFNWGLNAPAPEVGSDNFAVRWSGQVEAPTTETYTFRTTSDEGVRLTVNGQLIIDAFNVQTVTMHEGSVALPAGQKVDIVLEYFEGTGSARSRLEWFTPTLAREIVPTAVLFSDPAVPVVPAVQLTAETLVSGLSRPTSVDFTADGTAYILTQEGRVFVQKPGAAAPRQLLNLTRIVNFVEDRGAISVAVHPDLENHPYIYVAYTYDPPQTRTRTGLAGPDGEGNRAARVTRWTLDAATDYTRVVRASGKTILGKASVWRNISRPDKDSTNDFTVPPSGFDANGNSIRDFIASDSLSHSIAAMEFGPDGNLYVSIGDGTSFGNVDVRAVRVQDIDNLSGKVLRVDPLTGLGVADNPFFNGDNRDNRSKVFAYGLRNPFRMSFSPTDGRLLIGDVGWADWEEINRTSEGGGDNFGWPYYEGGFDGGVPVNERQQAYQHIPEAVAFYASNADVTAPLYARSHQDGAQALSLGDFITSTRYVGLQNTLVFSDFVEGTLSAAFLKADGSLDRVLRISDPIGTLSSVRQGPDGYLYFTDLFGGRFGRLITV